MHKYIGYRCSLCDSEFEPDAFRYTCQKDGGNLDVILDYDHISQTLEIEDITSSKEQSLWRYLPLLPVGNPTPLKTPLHSAGWTPVYAPKKLAARLRMENLWVKDESRNPTASFKDRASAIVVTRAKEIDAEVIVTASTGNAGAALAGMAAAVDHKAIIFAPRTAPPAKIAQLLIYGAQVILIDGSYDDAFDLTIEATDEFGWYCRNTGYNPFTAEGKKTAAYEIWEWGLTNDAWKNFDKNVPAIFVSVGDGNIISGIHKGFKDLLALGWIEIIPRIFGVQSFGSASITNTFNAGDENIIQVSSNTIADSISVDFPSDGVRAVRAARETGGSYIRVSDDEILSAIAELGQVGIFAEPAGATAYAGAVRAIQQGLIGPFTPTMVINTGSGLKDVQAAMRAVKEAPVIEPTIDALKQVIK